MAILVAVPYVTGGQTHEPPPFAVPLPTPTPHRADIATLTLVPTAPFTRTPIEKAEVFCSPYQTLMDRTEEEAAKIQDTALNVLMWEIRGTYGKQVGEYCESSNPPPLAEFFNLIRPSSTWAYRTTPSLGATARRAWTCITTSVRFSLKRSPA